MQLGDLIAAVCHESRKLCADPVERKVLVRIALKDLLNRKVRTAHPVVFF